MRVRRALVLLSLVAAAVAVAPPVSAAPPATQPARPLTLDASRLPSSASTPRPEAAGSSDQAPTAPVTTAASGSAVQPALRQRLETTTQAAITVEVITGQASAADAVAAVGGTVVRELAGLALVTVPTRNIARLAVQPGVSQVRLPTDMRAVMARSLPPRTEAGPVLSEWAAGTEQLFGPGDGGIGQRIGIIGLFDTTVLAQQVAAGELRSVPVGHSKCISAGATCPFGTPGADYGNAIAEVVQDAAPFADLYLAELGGGTDYLAAIDWMAANGVTTLLHYWTAPYDGDGAGTGFSASVVDYAVAKGITWVNAAGELGSDPAYSYYGGPHWRGSWSDPDNDRWLNFSGTDESLTAYCGALMGLRWNDWAANRTDYDLHISDFRSNNNTNGTRVLASAFNQGTGGAPPVEANDLRWLCNHDPSRGPIYDTDGDNFVSLWVQRTTRSTHTPVGDVLEITVLDGWLEHSNNPASIAVPFADTRSTGAIVVGAFQHNISVPWWSSRGPTNDGRIRPDLSANTCIHTSLTPASGPPSGVCPSGLADTAGPAATVAGFSAVLSPRQSVFRPVDRARYLIDLVLQSQEPHQRVRNNDRGWGVLSFGQRFASANSLTDPHPLRLLAQPVRILETRPTAGLVGTATPGPVPADTFVKLSLSERGLSEGDVALLNVTLVTPPALGWVQVYPPQMSWVGASSNLNAAAVGVTVPNLVAVRVDRDGKVAVYNRGGGHLVVDLLGSFSWNGGAVTNEGRYVGLTPYQVADTTTCSGIPVGCTGQALAAGAAINVPLGGTSTTGQPTNGIPTTGTYAAVVSVTAAPLGAGGWASVVPGFSTGTPTTSTLNFTAGRAATNMAIVPISSADGSMRLYTSAAAHYRIDVLGYFRVPTATNDLSGLFVAPAPTRLTDTRGGGGTKVPANGLTEFDLGSVSRYSGTDDVWLNVTSTGATGAGSLQVSGSATIPFGNHVNLSIGGADRTVASAAISRVTDATGVVRNSVSTHVIVDLVGWFTPPAAPLAAGSVSLLTTASGASPGAFLEVTGVSADHEAVLLSGVVDSPSVVPGSTLTWWDRTDDTFTSIDVRPDNSVFAANAMLTGDGQSVVFTSYDNNIVPGDTDSAVDIFLRTAAGTMEMVSVSSNETPTSGHVQLMGVSDDGRYVVMMAGESTGWGAGEFFLRDRTAGTTTSIQSMLPGGSPAIRSVTVSADGTRLVAVLIGQPVAHGSYATQTPMHVAFIQLGGGVTIVPYAVRVGFGTFGDADLTDVAIDGSSAVIGRFLVGVDGEIAALPGHQISDDGSVVTHTCYPNDQLFPCKVFTDADGPQWMHRTEGGAVPNGPLRRVVMARDGSLYLSSGASNLGPAAPLSGTKLYVYDPTP